MRLQRHAAQRVQTMHLEPGAKSFPLLPLQSPSLYFCKSTHPPIRLDRVGVHMQYAETNFLCVSQDMLPKGFEPCALKQVQSPSIFCLCKVPLSIFASLYFCKSAHPPIRPSVLIALACTSSRPEPISYASPKTCCPKGPNHAP